MENVKFGLSGIRVGTHLVWPFPPNIMSVRCISTTLGNCRLFTHCYVAFSVVRDLIMHYTIDGCLGCFHFCDPVLLDF